MPNPIPLTYRLFFLYLDPLLNFSGIYLSFFDHSTYISNGVPSSLHSSQNPPSLTPLETYLINSLGAWALSILSLQILILHLYKTNIKLWKILQFSILLTDLALVYCVYLVDPRKAVEVGRWESGDWVNNGILALVASVRMAFLAGVGGVGRSY